ncbi:hypothetical protein PYCC9005_000917 [Savitreella phatthalungensis]
MSELIRARERRQKELDSIAHAQSTYQPSHRPAVILEEDEYVDALGAVIRRNFFPQSIKQIDGDIYHPFSSAELREDTQTMTLSEWQAKYTSTDNASFLDLLDKGNLDRRAKYSWLYAKHPAAPSSSHNNTNRLLTAPESTRQLALTDTVPHKTPHPTTVLTHNLDVQPTHEHSDTAHRRFGALGNAMDTRVSGSREDEGVGGGYRIPVGGGWAGSIAMHRVRGASPIGGVCQRRRRRGTVVKPGYSPRITAGQLAGTLTPRSARMTSRPTTPNPYQRETR